MCSFFVATDRRHGAVFSVAVEFGAAVVLSLVKARVVRRGLGGWPGMAFDLGTVFFSCFMMAVAGFGEDW